MRSTILGKGTTALILAFSGICSAYTVYFVGNSHTDDLMYNEFDQMVESTGKQLDWGRHMIPGAPLSWLWDHPDGQCEQPYGCYSNALPSYSWDFMTLQCHSRTLDNPSDGDLPTATKFINEARKGNPDVIAYIYTNFSTDPDTRDWDRWRNDQYTGSDLTWLTADYYKRLVNVLRDQFSDSKPENIRLAPNGFILYELYRRINEGGITGMSSILDAYIHDMHLNELGGFIVATGLYAVFFQESPVGLSGAPYGVADELARQIQELVWDVVTGDEIASLTGLSGETTSVGKALTPLRGRERAAGQSEAFTITGRRLRLPASGATGISLRVVRRGSVGRIVYRGPSR